MATNWKLIATSKAAQQTINPIRKIVDRLKIPPHPDKPMISLGLGDPTVYGDLDCHPIISKIVSEKVLETRSNGYPPASGCDKAKEAIAARYNTETAPLTANDVIISSGCSGALELAFGVLADQGDSILLPRPGFTLYTTICQSKGINPVYYTLQPNNNWEVDLDAVRSLIRDNKPVAWLVNNPSNPCGSVYSRKHLEACLELADEFGIPVIADEIYEDMVFSGHQFFPMRTLTKRVPILTCGGMAKRFLVPGWRVGWILVTDPTAEEAFKDVRSGLVRLCGVLLGANSLVQAALPKIFQETPNSFHQETNKYLERNADIAARALEGIPGVSFIKPQGAMYMMVGFEMAQFNGSFKDDIQLGELLVSQESVLCLPGTIFGMPNYLRIVLCSQHDKLEEACQRIRRFCVDNQKSA